MPKKRHWFFDSHKYQVRSNTLLEYTDGHVIKTHSHPWHQLVYASQGVMTVRTPEGAWVVPIHRGVWGAGGNAPFDRDVRRSVAANAVPGAQTQPHVA